MRNVTLALGSFVLGAMCISLVENRTSISAQEYSSIHIAGAAPVVPPIFADASNSIFANGKPYEVDGLKCENCTFRDAIFRYGGGSYDLVGAKTSLPLKIELTGAAWNTAQFLSLFGLLGCPAQNQPPMNKPPIIQAKIAPQGNLRSAVI